VRKCTYNTTYWRIPIFAYTFCLNFTLWKMNVCFKVLSDRKQIILNITTMFISLYMRHTSRKLLTIICSMTASDVSFVILPYRQNFFLKKKYIWHKIYVSMSPSTSVQNSSSSRKNLVKYCHYCTWIFM
jgi:hypothetical protein